MELHIGTPSIRNSFNIDTINEYPIIETPYLNTSVFPSKGGYKYSESPQQISTQLTGILINESQQEVCEKELSELLTLDININEKYFIKITDIADLELDIETFNKIKPFIVE